MAYRKALVAYAVVGLTLAGAWGMGCASIIGADEYKVAGGGSTSGPTGAGGSDATTTTSTTSTGTAGGTTTGSGGTGGTTCSGPTPQGQAMCGAGKTCNTDDCGPPVTFACFSAGSVQEGGACTDKTDCAVGLTCIHYSTVYACRKLCTVNTDCPAGFLCSEGFTCGDNPDTAGRYCAKPCSDVVTAAGSSVCATGFRCNFLCDKTTHAPVPPTCDFEAGTQRSGACESDEDCAAGYYCLATGTDGGASCTQACRSNGDCTAGA
jgi:hypothetical protein